MVLLDHIVVEVALGDEARAVVAQGGGCALPGTEDDDGEVVVDDAVGHGQDDLRHGHDELRGRDGLAEAPRRLADDLLRHLVPSSRGGDIRANTGPVDANHQPRQSDDTFVVELALEIVSPPLEAVFYEVIIQVSGLRGERLNRIRDEYPRCAPDG